MRFKGFKDEWSNAVLRDIITIKNGKDQKPFQKSNSTIPVYGTGGVIGYVDKPIYDKDSIGIGRKGTIDKPVILKHPFWTVDTLFYTKLTESANLYFTFCLLQTVNWMKYNQSTGVPSLTSKVIEEIPCSFPSIIEQKKIGQLFEILDKRIEIQRKLIKSYESLIKGIRYTLLNSIKQYSIISLEKLCSIKTGKLDANAMKTDGMYKFFTCSKEDYYIDSYAFDGEAILIAGNGEVGLTKYYKGKFNAYQRTYVLQDFKVSGVFIKHYLDEYLPRIIKKGTNNSAMPYITLNTLADISVKVPEKSVQSMINTNLNYLLNYLKVNESILDALLRLKKALMSQIFI